VIVVLTTLLIADMCLLSPLELVLFLKELKEGQPLTSSHEMNLLKAAIHPINFWTSWRLSGDFIFVIVDTFSGLASISQRETICLRSFPEGTLNVHFLGFSFILNFFRLSKVFAMSEMSLSSSRVFTTTSSTYASALRPSWDSPHMLQHLLESNGIVA
jgi:hypothetical protein